jgi:AcrR family transcriptional regulator
MRRRGQDELRRFLLDTAGRLLTAEGPAALTMRRVAAEVGCSTTVLYTQFGGKDGLAAGLYREGFARFQRRFQELPPSPGPLERIRALSAAYRAGALAEPHYYRVMFLGAVPGFVPGPDDQAVGNATFQYLIDAAADCMAAGVYRPGEPAAVAQVLWAAAHGVISLEVAGVFGPEGADQRYADATEAATAWFISPSGGGGAG